MEGGFFFLPNQVPLKFHVGRNPEIPKVLPKADREFPLLAIRGKAPVLSWSTASLLPGAELEVSAVRLFVVQTSPANEPWIKALVTQESGQVP